MTRTQSRRETADAIQKIVEDLTEADERLSSDKERPSRLTDKVLASTLVLSQVHHVDYVGSNGSVPALVEDIQSSSPRGRSRADSETLSRHLARCGWYVDQAVTFDSVSPWVDDPEHPTVHARAGLLEEALRRVRQDYSNLDLDDRVVSIPYYLVEAGVTHPDFRDKDRDPTAALDRALVAIGFISRDGEARVWPNWSERLAQRGWTADLKSRSKKG